MGKRKGHYKAKNGGGRGQFQKQHEAGKRAAKRGVKKEVAAKPGGFEQWAERMVENPLKFLEWTVGFILAAALIKILIT